MPPVQSGGTDDAIHIPRLFQHWTSNFPHNYVAFGKNLPHIKDPAIMGARRCFNYSERVRNGTCIDA